MSDHTYTNHLSAVQFDLSTVLEHTDEQLKLKISQNMEKRVQRRERRKKGPYEPRSEASRLANNMRKTIRQKESSVSQHVERALGLVPPTYHTHANIGRYLRGKSDEEAKEYKKKIYSDCRYNTYRRNREFSKNLRFYALKVHFLSGSPNIRFLMIYAKQELDIFLQKYDPCLNNMLDALCSARPDLDTTLSRDPCPLIPEELREWRGEISSHHKDKINKTVHGDVEGELKLCGISLPTEKERKEYLDSIELDKIKREGESMDAAARVRMYNALREKKARIIRKLTDEGFDDTQIVKIIKIIDIFAPYRAQKVRGKNSEKAEEDQEPDFVFSEEELRRFEVLEYNLGDDLSVDRFLESAINEHDKAKKHMV